MNEVVRTVDIRRADTRAEVAKLGKLLAEEASRGAWISFDVETRADGSSYEDWHPSSRIVSVAFALSADQAYVVPLSHPHTGWSQHWKEVAKLLFECLVGARLIGANVKYDARWVRSIIGVNLFPYLAWDTQGAAFLMNENQGHGLKQRAIEDLGVDPWADVSLKDSEKAPWVDLARYNAFDAAHTYALHEWQRDRLRRDPARGKVMWHILMPTIRALGEIEHNGLLPDIEEITSRLTEAEAERDRLYTEFEKNVPAELAVKFQPRFGGDRLFEVPPVESERLSLAPTSKFFKTYAKERWPVLETTDNGAPSWDAAVLKRLAKRGYEDAAVLVDYRKVDKQIMTYLSKWPGDRAADGRLHATFKPMSVVTGRLACERPNLHQVDRKLKPCFIAPSGWKFTSFDYSQIELRFAAMLSGDENLLRAYTEERDVHRLTAAAVTGKPEDDITPEERYQAKAVNFGFLYGQLAPGFRNYAFEQYGLEISLEEAEDARTKFFELYPGLLDYHEKMRRFVRKHGYVETPFGRRRHLPEINSRQQQRRWSAERQAINAPIQSGASDLMLLALVAVTEWSKDQPGLRVVSTVHDSLLLEVEDTPELDGILQQVGELMVSPPGLEHFAVGLSVPVVVECEVGDRWGVPDRTLTVTNAPQEVV